MLLTTQEVVKRPILHAQDDDILDLGLKVLDREAGMATMGVGGSSQGCRGQD